MNGATIERLVPIGLLFVPVLFSLFVTGAGIAVFRQSYRRMKESKDPYLDVGGWIALIVPAILLWVTCAIMGVGASKEVILAGSLGIAGMIVSVLGPIFGLKSVSRFSTPQAGTSEVTSEERTVKTTKVDPPVPAVVPQKDGA